jgi:DNA repair exonuclease SbcCD ATPase subunit
MTTPAARSIELTTLERGEARQPPQQQVNWCGRQVQRLPIYFGGVVGIGCLGAAAYEGSKKNWFAVGFFIFVAVGVAIIAYCYYRNIPIKTMEQSAEDMQNSSQTLSVQVKELEAINGENRKTIARLEAVVKDAKANEERTEEALKKAQAELKDVTEKLSDAKGAFERIQVISNQFREGVNELAKKVLNFTNAGNEKLKKEVSEIADTIAKIDQLGLKIDTEARELKENNEQMDEKIQDYKKLLSQLGTVVEVLLPDYDAHKETLKEFDEMRVQNEEMKKRIEQLTGIVKSLETSKDEILELQKLNQNLSDPNVISKLGDLLKAKGSS